MMVVTISGDQQITLMYEVVKSITHFGASQSRIHRVARRETWERCQREKIQGEDNNCDHLRWPTDSTADEKSGKKHYTLRSVSKHKSQICQKQTAKKIRKKMQCGDDGCDHLCWPTDIVDEKVVESITHFGASQSKTHEVARSQLPKRY